MMSLPYDENGKTGAIRIAVSVILHGHYTVTTDDPAGRGSIDKKYGCMPKSTIIKRVYGADSRRINHHNNVTLNRSGILQYRYTRSLYVQRS